MDKIQICIIYCKSRLRFRFILKSFFNGKLFFKLQFQMHFCGTIALE